MLSPVEIGAIIAATKGAVDIFDKLAGPIKRVILGQPKFEQAEAKDQRWRFRVETEGKDVVVKEGDYTRQKIAGAELSQRNVSMCLRTWGLQTRMTGNCASSWPCGSTS